MESLTMILPLILLIVIMYFLLIRPQKKREKQVTAMRNAIKVGDQVITIGGIRGKIVKTKDEILTIQVGSEKQKFDIMRWAISKVEDGGEGPITKAGEEPEEAPTKKTPKRMAKPADEKEDDKEEEKKPAKPKKMGKASSESEE